MVGRLVGWLVRGTTGGVDGITSSTPTPPTKDRIYTRRVGQGHVCTRAHTVAIDACVIRVCVHPAVAMTLRACQTDDEKELVHSGYPREVEGIRAGGGGGGGSLVGRGRGWNKSRDRVQEQRRVQRQELEGGRK